MKSAKKNNPLSVEGRAHLTKNASRGLEEISKKTSKKSKQWNQEAEAQKKSFEKRRGQNPTSFAPPPLD